MNPMPSSFVEVLAASGPHPSLGPHAHTYGRLVGSWVGEVRNLMPATPVPTTVLEGQRRGDDIVQLGTRGGRLIRWTFSEIRADSFLWQGHVLEPDGATWRLEVEIRARRTGA